LENHAECDIEPAAGILHGLIRQQAPKISVPLDGVITAFALFLTIVAAWVSYRYLESPILRFGQRFQYTKVTSQEA